MAYLIDHLPDDVLWRATPFSTEEHPIVEYVEVIIGKFVDPPGTQSAQDSGE